MLKAPTPRPGGLRHTSDETVVYTPTSPLRRPGQLLGAMLADLVASRSLAWRLFLRDTAATYRQSILGYLWAFLPPIATTATFVYLSSQNIISVGATPVPYPAYVVIGTLLWQSFVDALNSPLRAVAANRALLTKVNFPREALLLAGVLDVVFNSAVRLILLAPVMLFYHVAFPATALLLPLGISGLVLLGLSIGLLLTPLALLYTDIGRALSIATTFWLFLTPVVYPPAKGGLAALISRINPVTPVLSTSRDWLLGQPAGQLAGFFAVSVLALLGALVGWVLFRLALPHLIERMGS